MYFHLIGIKEKDGQQYQLDLLIGDEEREVIDEFLEKWKIVVISLESYEKPVEEFGTIEILTTVDKSDFTLILSQKQFEGDTETGNPLERALRFLFSLGIAPKHADFLDTPLPQSMVESLINKISLEYEEARELWAKEQEKQLLEEKKKYEDSNMKKALKVINANIDRTLQLLEVGRGILTLEEEKRLLNLSNELKKIRLGSNFNRMVQLLMDTQVYVTDAEAKVLKQLDSKKFLIDRRSSITNIDVIAEHSELTKAEEKYILQQPLNLQEQLYLSGKNVMIFIKFFVKDLRASFDSLEMLLPNMLVLLEYLVLAIIVMLSAFWIFSALFSGSHLPYYLPMFWWLGFLLYLYNQCDFKNIALQIVGFVVLVGLYIWGMALIKATFAF